MNEKQASLQLYFEDAISAYSNRLQQQPANLYDPIRYILSLGGKRMRPLLTLIGCKMYHEDQGRAIHAALAIELFHNFSLIHDDIMDNAPLRRGKHTVHEKWNSNIAILSGDAMLVEAYKQIAQVPAEIMPRALETFSRTAEEVCEGQQYDMDFETAAGVTIPDYIRMIERKTAVLLGAALKIGAYCGNATETQAEHLYEFGRTIGIAFQLHDDILDVYGDAAQFGKQTGGDILANKKTFLLLKALERANGYKKEELLQWLQAPASAGAEKVKAVTAIYDYLGIKELAEAESNRYYEEGITHLDAAEANPEWKNYLRNFTDQLMVRQQ